MTGVQTGAFPRKGSRMDEYTFNKDSTRSPGQIYNVVDSREFSFRDKFKVNVESFGKKGTRFLPKRIELSPSPHEYLVKREFDIKIAKGSQTTQKEYAEGKRQQVSLWQMAISENKKLSSGASKHLTLGPGSYGIVGGKIDKHLKFRLGKFSERKFDYIKFDRQFNLDPGQYQHTQEQGKTRQKSLSTTIKNRDMRKYHNAFQ